MRLIHATELRLHEFFDEEIPEYAILSHRWGKEEVSYEDFVLKRGEESKGDYQGYGWEKIVKACGIAQKDGLEWVWIDTCCIDKKSSAELSEAINSMYKWYSDAIYCYVFLPDVPPISPSAKESRIEEYKEGPGRTVIPSYSRGSIPRQPFDTDDFVRSDWFRRSWTLQELLAPYDLYFFNNAYGCIGERRGLSDLIGEATSIPTRYLDRDDVCFIHDASVAERMRWASTRKATRKEDIAYSLLGLLDVNMPLLYGEGERAFQRLQMEIIRTSDDESIFAWERLEHPGATATPRYFGCCLAPNIGCFSTIIYERVRFPRQHYEVTNKGVKMMLPIAPQEVIDQDPESFPLRMLVPLNCSIDDDANDGEELVENVICLLLSFERNLSMGVPEISAAHQHLYLHARVEDCELIKFAPCSPTEIPEAVEDFLRQTERQDLVASYDAEDCVVIPVYLQI